MTEYAARALLPEGLHDELPPAAEHEAAVTVRLVQAFAAHGYQRVKPPLIEFEESLTTGPGGAKGTEMFRLVDPASQRMMAVRSDMTVQVARIAATRLQKAPRPLRLSYAGQVLRVKGTQLRPERQFTQAGVELVGVRSVAADAEVVLLAAESIAACGNDRPVTVDLTLPTLVPAIAAVCGLPASEAAMARDALDGKDIAALDAIGGPAGEIFRGLLRAAGPADRALDLLAALDLPPVARAEVDELAGLVAAIRAADPRVVLTIDPGEYRAHEYHTGFGFTLFAAGVRGELGRGGRYDMVGPDGGTEEAVGFTIYVDSLLRSLAKPAASAFVYLPFGTPLADGRALRSDGHRTIAALAPAADAETEAKRLGCSHIFLNGAVRPLAA